MTTDQLELYGRLDVATRLDIGGRWAMSKADLVAAIDKANRSATAKAAR